MANKFLDSTGVKHLWDKMKTYATDITVPAAVNLANQTSASNLLTAKAYTDEQFAKLLGGATAEELDTLKELSDALNDDKNFASTMTNAIANKQPLNENLTAIVGLTGTGLLKKTGTKTWILDTNTYLTSITKLMVTTALGYTPLHGTGSESLTVDNIEIVGDLYRISNSDIDYYATQSWVTGKGYITKATADGTYLGKNAKAASATVADSANAVAWDKVSSKPNTFTPPTATSSTLGGVKIGSNITVSSGTISLTQDNVTSALGYSPLSGDGGNATFDDVEMLGMLYKGVYEDGEMVGYDEYLTTSDGDSRYAKKSDLASALTTAEIDKAIE